MELCVNCGASVPVSIAELHQVHCTRFLTRCTCDQMIHINSKPFHLQEFHALQSCSYCSEVFEAWQKPLHNCPTKLFQCETCELFLIQEQYSDHQSVCLMRTVQCIDCKKYIKINEMKDHLLKECMPKLCEKQVKVENPHKNSGKKGKKKKGKKNWVCVQYMRKTEVPETTKQEDYDREIAENLLEEIIYSELAEEDDNFY